MVELWLGWGFDNTIFRYAQFFINYDIQSIIFGFIKIVSFNISKYLWIFDNIVQYWTILGDLVQYLHILNNIKLSLTIFLNSNAILQDTRILQLFRYWLSLTSSRGALAPKNLGQDLICSNVAKFWSSWQKARFC